MTRMFLTALLFCLLATAAPAANAPFPSGWTPYSALPVIPAGSLRHQALWNDPCVIKSGGTYVMYMTTSTQVPFQPPVLPFRATSTDGAHWKLSPATPLLDISQTPFASAETPSVVLYKGTYHMFFTGIYTHPGSAPMAVGHAQSADGIHWAVSAQPVLQASGRVRDWNGYSVAEPGAVVYNDAIYVYFTATGARASGRPPQDQSIGLATTVDGTHFTSQTRVLRQTGFYPSAKGYAGYSTPSAYVQGGRINLVYDVAKFTEGANPEWQQVAILHSVASNPDGMGIFYDDKVPMFQRSDFSWTSGEILAPTVLVDGAKLKMWFAGHVRNEDLGPLIQNDFAGPYFGIGYATK